MYAGANGNVYKNTNGSWQSMTTAAGIQQLGDDGILNCRQSCIKQYFHQAGSLQQRVSRIEPEAQNRQRGAMQSQQFQDSQRSAAAVMIGLAAGAAVAGLAAAVVVVLAEVEAVDGGRRRQTLAAITRLRRTGGKSYGL